MRIKYIGNCVKTDSITGVGLQWEPGQEREVTGTVGAHLLQFPDTWREVKTQKDDDEKEEAQEAIGIMETDTPKEEPLEMIDFHGMTKDQLIEFSMDRWGEKIDKRKNLGDIRQRVIERHTQEQNP